MTEHQAHPELSAWEQQWVKAPAWMAEGSADHFLLLWGVICSQKRSPANGPGALSSSGNTEVCYQDSGLKPDYSFQMQGFFLDAENM